MKGSIVQIIITVLVLYFFTMLIPPIIIAQENLNKSKPTLESGKITIKVKEGIGPLQKQEGSVSFGINSLDQKSARFEVYKLSEMFIHKPIPINSGLPDLSRIYQIEFPTNYNVSSVSREFSQDPNIEYAEPIPINYLLEEPNDPLYVQQWYLPKIQAELAWDIHKGEDGDSLIILSITDTGCRYLHPDIAQNIWNNLGEDFDGDGKTFGWNGSEWVFDPGDINNIDDDGNGFVDDFIGWNFDNNDKYPVDGYGHGTLVSGIAGATTNNNLGVASISYNLKIMPVKALDDQGSGINSSAYNSLIYSAENGANVINCSWGGWPYSEANREVIEYVNGLGSIIVAAAGNANSSEPLYPACYPYVIGVAAIDNQNIKTPYSTYGAGIDVSAPGPQTFQPFVSLGLNDGYANANAGTSFSSPIVTGLVGLIKSLHPTWTKDQIIQQLLYTTENINLINPGYEYLLGTGEINAYHSLADIDPTITPELKINMTLSSNELKGGLKITNPNSVANFRFMVQNYSHFLDANPLTITLTSNNPDILIIDGEYTGYIAANSIVELLDEFQIEILPNAATAIATLSFNVSANLPVVAGSVFEFYIIVNPSGVFVWEGEENGQNYSGTFIKNYLTTNNYPILYTDKLILNPSYLGFDAVFLSFGNWGIDGSTYTALTNENADGISEYLESGGKLFLDGSDALGYDQWSNTTLHNLLGMSSASDGIENSTPVTHLVGQPGALTEGMLFTSNSQQTNNYIDVFVPNSSGQVAFNEATVGNVAIQSTGSFGQRTFCFSYALGKLNNGTFPSTKENLLKQILEFFGITVPVELTSFTAKSSDGNVFLNWSTATETNNRIFEIERRNKNSNYVTIGFVEGRGTTTEQQEYSYVIEYYDR